MLEQTDGSYDNPFKFNAKELDDDTGLYYYGVRYYNPRLSIWYGVDPLAEKMPSWSPYAYTFDNPVRYTDPDGRSPLDVIYLNANGTINRVVNNGSDYITVVHKGKSMLIGNLYMLKNYEFKMNAIKNITSYYGAKIGAVGIVPTSEKDDSSNAFYSMSSGQILVNAQSNGLLDPHMNNKYDMMNIIYHENMHKYDDVHNIEGSTFSSHANVSLKTINHWTFKKSSRSNQVGQVGYFSQLIMNTYY